MIINDKQLEITKQKKIEFENALKQVEHPDSILNKVMQDAYLSQIEEFEKDIKEYELQSNKLVTYYRIENLETKQGLWYSYDGKFTGLIHTKFSFCKNHDLPMEYDENVVGYVSVTDTLTNLYYWFSKKDIEQLYQHGYKVSIYESSEVKEYPNQHLIKQDTAILKGFIEFDDLPEDSINTEY